MALGKYETIKTRYEKRWVRDDQLRRYWELGCITDEQYIEIYQTKYPEAYPEGLEPVVEEVESEETVTEPIETELEEKETEEVATSQEPEDETVTEEDEECTVE